MISRAQRLQDLLEELHDHHAAGPDKREYDFLLEDNITPGLLNGFSEYQKALLGRYCAGYNITEIAEVLGFSANVVGDNLHSASNELRRRVCRRFGRTLIEGEKAGIAETIDGISGRDCDFYQRVIEPQIIAVAFEKGYISSSTDEEFRHMRKKQGVANLKKRVLKTVSSSEKRLDRSTNGTPFGGFPSYGRIMDAINDFKKDVRDY